MEELNIVNRKRKYARIRARITVENLYSDLSGSSMNIDKDIISGHIARIEHWKVPKRFHRRFIIFSEDMTINYFYQTTYNQNVGHVDSNYFSIKIKAFIQYVNEISIETYSDKRRFIDFLNALISYEPDNMLDWQLSPEDLRDQNIEVKKEVGKIVTQYIRVVKINKILK